MTTYTTEREAFTAYLTAIGQTVGHDASAAKARKACPAEYAAWVAAFRREYGCDPS